MIQRSETKELTARLKEPRKFIQVIVGPRQVGKTTMVTQAMEQLDIPYLSSKYKPLQAFVVGNEGMPLADFLQTDLRLLFR